MRENIKNVRIEIIFSYIYKLMGLNDQKLSRLDKIILNFLSLIVIYFS